MDLRRGIWSRSWAQDSSKVGNIALQEPPSKPKTLEIDEYMHSGKNASFQRVALSPQNWHQLGLTWAWAAAKGAQLVPVTRC